MQTWYSKGKRFVFCHHLIMINDFPSQYENLQKKQGWPLVIRQT